MLNEKIKNIRLSNTRVLNIRTSNSMATHLGNFQAIENIRESQGDSGKFKI